MKQSIENTDQLKKDIVNLKKLYQKQQLIIRKLEHDNKKLKREKTELTLKVSTLTKQMKPE